jgi:hypothetical protein
MGAYNDCVYQSSEQYIAGNVTTYCIGSGNPGPTSGALVDKVTGGDMGITVTLTENGGVKWQPEPDNGGSDCAIGTDAYNTFGSIADMTGVIYYGSTGWWVELTFTGLDPTTEYTFATSAARCNYTNRLTIYTLTGADTYSNASTNGVDVLAENKVRFNTGDNFSEGYVARWTGITAYDGSFTVRAEADPGSTDGKAYSFDVFMLEGGFRGTDVQNDMLGVNASLWTRTEFNLDEGDPEIFDTLTLRMIYEDGFMAYLNGQEVTGRNTPNSLQWDSTALTDRPIEQASVSEAINIMASVHALRDGRNVLAIHGLNDGTADPNFLILPQLSAASNIDVPQYFTTPTPENFNIPGAEGIVEEVWFSHKRGFYDAPFQLNLFNGTDDAEIRYTLDGSRPTITHGDIYSTSLPIDETTTIRAVAVKPGWLDSAVETHTYIFLDEVISQPGRPVSAEWINPDGSTGFQIDCGLRIAGGFSRNPSVTDKHSLRLLFKGIYGPTKLEFPMFDAEDAVDRFDTITLRANANDSHGKGGSGGCGYGEAQFVRDEFVRQTQTVMGRPSSHGTFVHLYINGLYWGLYNPVERPASSFAASYFGGEKEDYDSLNSGNVKEGDKTAWNNMLSLADSSNEAYQRILGNNPDGTRNLGYPIYLDVENYIDYMINNHYSGNADWPAHNWYAARYRLLDSTGYKFFTWDAEHSIAFPGYIPSPLGLNVTGYSSGVAGTYIKIRGNPQFQMLFADRLHKAFFNGGAMYVDPNNPQWDPCTPERNLPAARYLVLANHVEQSILCECARWGDQTGTTYTIEDWRNERDRVIADYLPYRTSTVLQQYRNINLYPDLEAPVFRINGSYQHGGKVSNGDELTMDNPNGSGSIYYTTDGNDPLLPESLQFTGTTILAEDAPKKVLVPTGTVDASWKSDPAFEDSAWNHGTPITTGKTGGVGYETGTGYENYITYDVQAQMSAINATCYIRIPFTVDACDLVGINFMTLRMRYDDGFVAYINGEKIYDVYEPSPLLWNSSTANSGSHEAGAGFDEFPVSDHISAIQPGDNILAIHGLNTSTTSTDFIISAELVVGEANSTGGLSPNAIEYSGHLTFNKSTHIKARVRDGITWSALNEAVYGVGPVAENLRVTEIMYHPRFTGDPNDPNEEFVELKNIGPDALNLNLAEFTKGIDFIFPDIELESGEYVVVVKDISAFEAKYGTSVNIAGQYTGSLANDGERIKLRDAVGRTILDFEYGDGWRSITDGDGFSLTIIDPTDSEPNNWSEKESWRASVYRNGSPGWDDSGIIPNPGAVVINEVMSHSNAGPDWIELHNTTGDTINIGGWFLSDNSRSEPNLTKYRIADGTTIDANDYLVFYQDTDFNNPGDPGCIVPFGLSENGEKACLSSYLDPNGMLTGCRQVESFGASQTNVSLGRYYKPSTGNFNFVAMDYNTPDANNAYPKVGPVVINEIMYNPPSGNQKEEYIELHNITGALVTLYRYDKSTPWKFTDGIDYTFSSGPVVTIPAYGYLMVVKNVTAFTVKYGGMPPGVQVLIGYSGRLSNAGERLQIGMPGDIDELGTRQYIRIDRVTYSDGWHPQDCPGGVDFWPAAADGLGKSLSRKVPSDYGNDVANWQAAAPSPGVANP